MLKAIVSYSKKIPVPDSEYSSQGYSLSLETEITAGDAPAIQAKLHETFELVKSSVEQELANGSGQAPRQVQAVQPAPARTTPPAMAPRTGEKASNKQIKFILDLLGQRGLSLSDLNADVSRRFGVAGLYDLSRKEASLLLDELNGRQRQAA
jgi:hypothetical protein